MWLKTAQVKKNIKKIVALCCRIPKLCYFCAPIAEVAQLVEHHLAKVEVASSNLVFCSKLKTTFFEGGFFMHVLGLCLIFAIINYHLSQFVENIVHALMKDMGGGTTNAHKLFQLLPKGAKIDKDDIWEALKSLEIQDIIFQKSKNNYTLKKASRTLIGRLDINRRGVGFVVPLQNELDGDDVKIESRDMEYYLPGDTVECSYEQSSGGRYKGKITQVIKRTDKIWVGVLDVFQDVAYLVVDNKEIKQDILIRKGIKPEMNGMKAAVKITSFDKRKKNPLGELIDILGKAGSNDAEMHAIVAEFGFKTSFPPEVEAEANKFTNDIDKEEIKTRKDLRSVLTFTIDPEDAKDFDDAISYEELGDDTFRMGIHIADVSHFVQEGTALDREALNRGTSVYLADRTIPMLPEHLSNNLCSLRPNEDRLAFSAIFDVDLNGKVLKRWIGKTVIHSERRFTYEEAQERIVSNTGDLARELIMCNTIAKNLKEKRFADGAIAFESSEIRFKMDENGVPLSIIKKDRFDAHKLVEEFMLLANREVAEFIKNKQKPELPFIYRAHDFPPHEKLVELVKFAALWGYKLDISSEEKIRNGINELMRDTEGKPEASMLQNTAIRSMAKAIYTGKQSEHFGLAFKFYSHFTSPIRRYPDLLAHRLIFDYLNGKKDRLTASTIEQISEHNSNMEQKASDAERASTKYKMAEFMEQHEGETFEAKVSGITEWGIYAEIIENYCEGMIRLTEMKGDTYSFHEKEKKVIGKHSKRRFGMGDLITIKVKRADKNLRQIDFVFIED